MAQQITKQAKTFWKDGFLHIPSYFPNDLMESLEREALAHFGIAPELSHDRNFLDRAGVEVVPWFPQRENNNCFEPVDRNSGLLELTNEILGAGWQSQYCMVMFSKAGTVGQAWHQDCPPRDSAKFNINRLLYTSDITEDVGGAVVVMPGSHKLGLVPAGDPHEDLPGQVTLKPKKGDLILLHGHCWHRVMPVKSRYRLSVNYRAAPVGVDPEITDVCVYRNMLYRFSTAEVLEERTA